MIIIWSSADVAELTRAYAQSFKNFKPDIPPHQFKLWQANEILPVPEKGQVILVCGTKPLSTLQTSGIAPKNRSLYSLREKPIAHEQGYYLITFDPKLIASEPEKAELMDWDLRLAVRLMQTGTAKPQIGIYKYVNDYQPLIASIKVDHAKTGKPIDVACDIETMGFYPWFPDKDIVSISFTKEAGTAEVLYLGPQQKPLPFKPDSNLFEQIKWLLTTPKVKLRMANGKYDLIWITEKWGIECSNFKFDTMMVGSLLNENQSNSLNTHAKIYTRIGGYDDGFNTTYDKGYMETIPANNDYLTYSGGDTDATYRVADVLRDQLTQDEKLTKFYLTILHPAARAFEKIERRGVLVDQQKYHILREDLQKIIQEGNNKALSILPNKLRAKYREKIETQLAQGKNPLLPSILKDFFFSPRGLNLKPKVFTGKTNEPSMAKSHLKQFANVPEASEMVEALSEIDAASKTLSTFVEGFLKHLRPNGRFHSTYFLGHTAQEGYGGGDSGTVTGRLSCKDPAFQTLPKKTKWAKRLRECFTAPPDKAILSLDYSQGELRVVACVAPEPTMLKAYAEGLDLHAVTGAKLGNVELQEFLSWENSEDKEKQELFKKYRTNAKPANFGLLYGMQVQGFIAYAWANYGLKLSEKEAAKIRNDFFTLYRGLTKYHDRQKKMVHLQEMVRSPLGRIRHLPMIKSWDQVVRSRAERQAINSPIQSCLSDMMLWAIALIEQAYGDKVDIVGTVHDNLIAYVPSQDMNLWAARLVDIMENLPFHQLGWQPQLKFIADAEAGFNLAEMEKVKFEC